MLRPIAIATTISGTLDILFAMILTIAFGRHIGDMLRFVASGPFPAAPSMGTAGAILGLVVHFALMAMMATALMLLLRWKPERLETPVRTALAFGIVTYFAMNWLVVPLRFGTPLPRRRCRSPGNYSRTSCLSEFRWFMSRAAICRHARARVR
jgi:hypothetical protein